LKQIIRKNVTLAQELIDKTDSSVTSNILQFSSNKKNIEKVLERSVQLNQANYHYLCKMSDEDEEHNHHETQLLRYVEFNENGKSVSYEAFMESSLKELDAQEDVSIKGIVIDDVFLMQSLLNPVTPRKLQQEYKSSNITYASILVIRVNYLDSVENISEEQLNDEMQLAAKFLYENSYGQFDLNKRVVSPVVTLQQTKEYYSSQQPWTVLSDARDAAKKLGSQYDYSMFTYYAAAIPKTFSGWIGLGYVGKPGVWLNGRYELKVTAHEIGHNIGLRHASSLVSEEIPAVAYGGSEKDVEYGDGFDMMGGGTERHTAFTIRSKIAIGWVSPSQVLNVTKSGVYEIYANDDIDSKGKPLAIAIPYDPKTPKNLKYFIDYNRRLQIDNQWRQGGGLLLRMGYNIYAKGNSSHVIDTHPLTTTQKDAPIFPGQTFYADAGPNPVTITALCQYCPTNEPCRMNVKITFGARRQLSADKVTVFINGVEPTSNMEIQSGTSVQFIPKYYGSAGLNHLEFKWTMNGVSSKEPSFIFVPSIKDIGNKRLRLEVREKATGTVLATAEHGITFVDKKQPAVGESTHDGFILHNSVLSHKLEAPLSSSTGYERSEMHVGGLHEQKVFTREGDKSIFSDSSYHYQKILNPHITFGLVQKKGEKTQNSGVVQASFHLPPPNTHVLKTVTFTEQHIDPIGDNIHYTLQNSIQAASNLKSTISILGNGNVVALSPYKITANTILEFEFKAPAVHHQQIQYKVNLHQSLHAADDDLSFTVFSNKKQSDADQQPLLSELSHDWTTVRVNVGDYMKQKLNQDQLDTVFISFSNQGDLVCESAQYSNVRFLETKDTIREHITSVSGSSELANSIVSSLVDYHTTPLQYNWRLEYNAPVTGSNVQYNEVIATQSGTDLKSVSFPVYKLDGNYQVVLEVSDLDKNKLLVEKRNLQLNTMHVISNASRTRVTNYVLLVILLIVTFTL
jgi:hypothetical protein